MANLRAVPTPPPPPSDGGPPWTILAELKLPNGRVEYRIRQRGGREVVFRMSSVAVAMGTRDECITQALERLRPEPGPHT